MTSQTPESSPDAWSTDLPVFNPPRITWPDTPYGLCDICWRIFRDGKRGESPARYLWVSKVGNAFRVCEACTADWRKNALVDADLMPARIRTIDEDGDPALGLKFRDAPR